MQHPQYYIQGRLLAKRSFPRSPAWRRRSGAAVPVWLTWAPLQGRQRGQCRPGPYEWTLPPRRYRFCPGRRARNSARIFWTKRCPLRRVSDSPAQFSIVLRTERNLAMVKTRRFLRLYSNDPNSPSIYLALFTGVPRSAGAATEPREMILAGGDGCALFTNARLENSRNHSNGSMSHGRFSTKSHCMLSLAANLIVHISHRRLCDSLHVTVL